MGGVVAFFKKIQLPVDTGIAVAPCFVQHCSQEGLNGSTFISHEEELKLLIEKDEKEPQVSTKRRGKLFVKDLINQYEKNGSPSDRPLLLSKLFDALKTIPPSSVESERAFSTTGQFVTKMRTRLKDETVDALVFLKFYHKKNDNSQKNVIQNSE